MNKTYAVTGAASGIGAELARLLQAKGHTVIGFDRIAPTFEIDHFIELDLNDDAALHGAASQTPLAIDGLCNNAGVPPRPGQETAILQINFTGTRAFTQAMLPHMAPGASIVNIASRAGHGWQDNLAQVKAFAALHTRDEIAGFVTSHGLDATRCYNLSKEAVILWTLAMTEQLVARDIRINSLSPGGIATGILDDFKRAFGDKVDRNIKRSGRPGAPQEVAEVAAFVLSEQSHWLKGADIAIDGGMGAFNMTDALGLDALCLRG